MSDEVQVPADNLRRTAIIYDFDGTLAKGNLQETSFIPDIGMSKEEFWAEVKRRKVHYDADEILVYMQLMLDKARVAKVTVSKDALLKHGQDAELFPGLIEKEWFLRINDFAEGKGLHLEHFIISSGIEEMIRGCAIADAFKHIFASKFVYEGDIAVWPGVAINYTTKTQYLFRINKNILNHWDSDSLNAYTPEKKREIPFERMIFIGDGDTDIPTMKMLTYKGGHSIAVYDSGRGERDMDKIQKLLSEGRVDFVAPADFVNKSQIDIIVKGILGRIALMY
jgi:phosphoserine phosphatase